ALDMGPREVSGENRTVVLARPGAAHRAPLTQAHAMAPPRAGRDHARDLTTVLRHGKLKGRTPQQLIGPGPQHGPHIGPLPPRVARRASHTPPVSPATPVYT